MRLGILSCLGFFASTIPAQSTILDQDKPFHIGVSINFASRSHIKYLLEILEEVSKKGHRITYLAIDEHKRFAKGYNVTHYSLGDIKMNTGNLGDVMPFTSKSSHHNWYKEIIPTIVELYESTFPIYEKFYQEDKPDLMICDFVASSCIESAGRNTIPLMMGYQSLMYSTPAPYLTINGFFEPTTIETFSFWQRFKHGIIDPIKLIVDNYPVANSVTHLRNYYKVPRQYKFPLFSYLGLGIANSYVGFENPRKISSHTNLVGPILSEEIPELPQELESFLNDHSKVLYVAFGSMIRLKPELAKELLKYFQRAFNEGIIDGILWGGLANSDLDKFPKRFTFDSQEYSTKSILDGTHEKIKMLKWAPQESILHHPNTKLFLSHGGLDSIYESLRAGTPMLVLPFLADQPRNGILVKENGVGDYIEWPTMGDQVIYQKFVKLLDSNNLQLQSKVRQLQLITKFSSKRKAMAANLIETYALSAKSCRMFETPEPFGVPCEMKPYLPLDFTMSAIQANLIDVYVIAILMVSILIFGIIYFTIKTISQLFKKLFKLKLD